MKEYQFQYTKPRNTLAILLACFAGFIIIVGIGVFFKLPEPLIFIIELAAMVSLFHVLKKSAVSECVAKIGDTSVEFDFGKTSRVIKFVDLISFKAYYGKNGPVLYLKNNLDNFKISANNNYCKTDNFKSFCQDIIIKLDGYKNKSSSEIIHEGSIFATRGMLYFLIIATSIYLLAFFMETKELKLYVGIGGGFYLLIMWLAFYYKRDLKSR